MIETVLCGSFANNAIGGISETLIRKGFATTAGGALLRKALRIKDLEFLKNVLDNADI